jgi:hypothetical protein
MSDRSDNCRGDATNSLCNEGMPHRYNPLGLGSLVGEMDIPPSIIR